MMVVGVFSLTAMLAFMALLFGVGFLLAERRALQNAADAGSLAGVWKLAEEQASRSFADAPVADELERVARLNGLRAEHRVTGLYIDSSGADLAAVGGGGRFPDGAVGLRVTVSGPFTSVVAPGLLPEAQLSVEAKAQLGRVAFPPRQANPAPLAIPLAAFEGGGEVDLYDATLADARYGVADYRPFLDLANAANRGDAYVPARAYGDLHTNLQYWSDGSHDSGTVGVGAWIAIAGDDFEPDVQTGLLDNVRRQGLVDQDGLRYILISLPLWATYTRGAPDLVEITGYATLKVLERDIRPGSVRATFVPWLVDPPGGGRSDGPFWGPSVVRLSR